MVICLGGDCLRCFWLSCDFVWSMGLRLFVAMGRLFLGCLCVSGDFVCGVWG